jgi:hypothetical protein
MSDEDLQYYDMGYDDGIYGLEPYYPGFDLYMLGYRDGRTDTDRSEDFEYDMDDGS